jgi:glycosyltransferase involved in cell wall biosynthesis
MEKEIIINGRFLTMPLSGIQRVAYELITALDDLLERGEVDAAKFRFVLLHPGKFINSITLKHIHIKKVGALSGNLWEQLELPFYSRNRLLISLCSISPLVKTRQIVMVHDASFFINKQFFSRAFRLWYCFAIPLIMRRALQILTVSGFSNSELIKYTGVASNKIAVIPNAADHIVRFGKPADAFAEKINSFKPYCLAVSNLGANKNFSGLTKAISLIDFTGYKMLIAGGESSTLQRLAPDDKATYLGYVSDEELKYLYTNASLFVFPSFYEGFGIPPLEAMILGCPVAASNTSAIPEILEEACCYFDPANAGDIAAKISELINDAEKLNELREKGYRQAAKYKWKNSALQLFNLIVKNHG